jgi:REP element-mobilizing transposase RayT
LISPALEARVHACIAAKCRELKCDVLAIGGTEDHLHVLVRLHATVSVAELVKEMKGSSSHLATHVVAPDAGFKWQATYGAFSVGVAEIDRICTYIKRQKQHHAEGSVVTDWERCKEEATEAR